jgi:predicted RNA-binding protein YlxR (DUF448 family)
VRRHAGGRLKRPVLRTCVFCKSVREKAELARFAVRVSVLSTDVDKKLGGRGAYACRTRECIGGALARKGAFSRALKTNAALPDEAEIFSALRL